ncbi:hypothetical protein J3E64_002680 [Sphingobium sp. OAS761]|uniref:hypothetical protein n=1 Tax=Sphingobium sp. OAS761 TaxID=2817901 RepID=UPI00209C8717|nr:hypothetical protein [Sphingobium sp. OAS761]MCP1470983.1 hypothetical protein [Sphingobium sp. OAS761]
MKSSQYQFEGLLLTGSPTDTFADFYRDHIRHADGARLAAEQLKAAYERWADDRDLATSSPRAIRSFMEANGHRHRKSSIVFYLDAVLGDFEGQPVPARAIPVTDGRKVREAVSVTLDDLDQIITELQGMRSRIARIKAAVTPWSGR